jgi:sensor domain CHASE-containing protein
MVLNHYEHQFIVSETLKNLTDDEKTTKFPFLVLAVCILLTIGATYSFYQSAKNKDSIRFSNEVKRIQSAVENKINLYVALLNSRTINDVIYIIALIEI